MTKEEFLKLLTEHIKYGFSDRERSLAGWWLDIEALAISEYRDIRNAEVERK